MMKNICSTAQLHLLTVLYIRNGDYVKCVYNEGLCVNCQNSAVFISTTLEVFTSQQVNKSASSLSMALQPIFGQLLSQSSSNLLTS